MIVEEKQFILVHVPKTGGMSFSKALKKSGYNVGEYGHHKASYYNKYPCSFNRVALTRCPFSRLESAYSYLKNGGMNANDKKDKKFFIDPHKSFRDFVLAGDFYKQTHFRPLSYWIDTEIDYIEKFENYNESAKKILKLAGICDIKLQCVNKTKNKQKQFFDVEMKNVIQEVYAEDFKRFDYNLEG